MEPASQTVPPVVAVVVVHQPGDWFGDVLDGLADQDYANLKCLFLVVDGSPDLAESIRARIPSAFVRMVEANAGYGATANEVSHLVEGDNGFFCFLHDDVALDETAIRVMVEELYRSNAGIVGPKLVEWDDPGILQHVGLGVDRFGEVDPFVEPGEVDQEQHDAVRDVFALPSACLLVRADLFRSVGGFDASITFHGDDVDLCWRAHLGGARVVVVPSARARHLEHLTSRRDDLGHERLAARHRMRSVATLTGARRLPGVLVQLTLISLVEIVVGVFTGTLRRGIASLGALFGLIPRLGQVMSRRRRLRALRLVPDSEIAGLQVRGSARLSSYLRLRDSRPLDPDATTERRWRQTAGSAPAIAWLTLLALVVVGSRRLITEGVPSIGEFLRYPASPRALLNDYRSGWSTRGVGSTAAAPTGLALIAVASVATLFHMGLAHTLGVVGVLVLGYLGMWRLGSLFPTARARITGLAVYAAVPLPSQALSVGRWGVLACYAACPWAVHLLRRAAGLETTGGSSGDLVERYAAVDRRRTARYMAQLALVIALAGAFSPAFLFIAGGVGAVLAVSTALAGGSWRAAVRIVIVTVAAMIVAVAAHLPWSSGLLGHGGWQAITGVPPVTSRSAGLARLAQFHIGRGPFGLLAIALFVPVVVAPLVAKSWRLTWAARAATLVVTFGWIAVLNDRGSFGFNLPEAGVLLAPVAVGVALSAACIAAAFADDVLGGSFGWRQPLGLVSAAAIGIGILPGLAAISSGRWDAPRVSLASVTGQLPHDPAQGDYRVLWVGNPDIIPVPATAYRAGIGFAVTDDGPFALADDWVGRPGLADMRVSEALTAMSSGTTLRAGRLLAPLGIRYIAVPLVDGAISTTDDPVPVPAGLLESLSTQLDLAKPLTSPPNFVFYENSAWLPTLSLLSPAGAAVSKEAGAEALARADLAGSTPLAVGMHEGGVARFQATPGTVHLAVPFDRRWQLTVNGAAVASHSAFGVTTAFDVTATGPAELRYRTDGSRSLSLVGQLVIWAVVALVASPISWRVMARRRKRPVRVEGAPLLSLDVPVPEVSEVSSRQEEQP